jgi:uncharacterized protein (TIGR03086 family)
MPDPREVFRSATAAVAAVVDHEPAADTETPCSSWTYGQLLGHVVGGDRLFTGLLTGAATPATSGPAQPTDQPAPSPEDYRAVSSHLATVFDDVGVRTGTFHVPAGALTGEQVIWLRSVEHVLHGWDLAKAAGAPTRDLEPLAVALERPARGLLAALGEQTMAERRPFATPVPVAETAPAVDRLVAAFGRDPGWAPDPVAGYARLVERFAGHDDVELPDGTRRGFGADGMRVDHQVFACTHRSRLMIKLPADEVDSLIGAGLGEPLGKPGQRPMREWVLVPFDGAAPGRTDRAYAFVSGQL